MPHINWHSIPEGVRRHLFLRLRERKLTPEDIAKLDRWIQTNPQVPEGPWWKDFGTFKLAGEGRYPKTFLAHNQSAFGEEV